MARYDVSANGLIYETTGRVVGALLQGDGSQSCNFDA
jgi:hypothetical protein